MFIAYHKKSKIETLLDLKNAFREVNHNLLIELLKIHHVPAEIIQLRGGSRAAATSKMECFVVIVNGWKPLSIITKRSILDVAAALDPPLQRITSLYSDYDIYIPIDNFMTSPTKVQRSSRDSLSRLLIYN